MIFLFLYSHFNLIEWFFSLIYLQNFFYFHLFNFKFIKFQLEILEKKEMHDDTQRTPGSFLSLFCKNKIFRTKY